MNTDKLAPESVEEEIDYSGRPFDYRDMDTSSAMICENDPAIRQKLRENLQTLNFNVIEPMTAKEALKYTTFQTFNVIVVNEHYDTDKDLSLIHISEPTRLLSISYAVFCLKKKKQNKI